MFLYTKSLIIITLFLTMGSSICWAKPTIAKVLLAVGTVTVERNKQSIRIKRRDKLYAGDKIIIADKSRAQVHFVDQAVLSLYANTELLINNYQFNNNSPDKNTSRFSLIKGTLRTLTGKIAENNPNNYRITSRIATVGIRGTIVKLGLETIDDEIIQYAMVEGSGSEKIFIAPCYEGIGQACDVDTAETITAGTAFNSAIIRASENKVDLETGANLGNQYFVQQELASTPSASLDTSTETLSNQSDSNSSSESQQADAQETTDATSSSSDENTENTDSAEQSASSNGNSNESDNVNDASINESQTVSNEQEVNVSSQFTSEQSTFVDTSAPIASSSNELNNTEALEQIVEEIVTLSLAEFFNFTEGTVISEINNNFTNVFTAVYETSGAIVTGRSNNSTQGVQTTLANFPRGSIAQSEIQLGIEAVSAKIASVQPTAVTAGGFINFGNTEGATLTAGEFQSPRTLDVPSGIIIDEAPLRGAFVSAFQYNTLPVASVTYSVPLGTFGYEVNAGTSDLNAAATVMNLTINFATTAVSGNFSLTSQAGNTWSATGLSGNVNLTNGNFTVNGTGTISNGGTFGISDNTMRSVVAGNTGTAFISGFNFSDGGSKTLRGVLAAEQ